MTAKAKISIRRPREWFGRFRKLRVLIDGEVVAWLKMGQTVDLEVNPGRCYLQVQMDWCSSQELEVHAQAEVDHHFVSKSPGIWGASKAMRLRPDSFFQLIREERAD